MSIFQFQRVVGKNEKQFFNIPIYKNLHYRSLIYERQQSDAMSERTATAALYTTVGSLLSSVVLSFGKYIPRKLIIALCYICILHYSIERCILILRKIFQLASALQNTNAATYTKIVAYYPHSYMVNNIDYRGDNQQPILAAIRLPLFCIWRRKLVQGLQCRRTVIYPVEQPYSPDANNSRKLGRAVNNFLI